MATESTTYNHLSDDDGDDDVAVESESDADSSLPRRDSDIISEGTDPSAMLVKIRADSMYAETDNEYSPELSGKAYDWNASCRSSFDCSPPPLVLPPPSHAHTHAASTACPKDFFAWTQLVATTGNSKVN